MNRTRSPIQLDSVHVMTVDIDFFVNVGNILHRNVVLNTDLAIYLAKELYSLIIIILSFAFVISAIASIFTVKDMNEFADSSNILIAMCISCSKLVNVLHKREAIINLMNSFLEEPCATTNNEEAQIQLKRNAVRYTLLIETAVSITVLNSLRTNFQYGRLTYRGWIPYNYTSEITFPLTFTFQLLPVVMQSLVQGATDSLFFGVLAQICCQFEILLFRLNDVTTNSQGTLRRFVRHHNCIYQLAGMTNKALYLNIFSQLFGSSLLLCLSLIQLIKLDILSTEFLATVTYMAIMIMQSFLYCWYGNEVKMKSIDLADMIFQVDWTGLNDSAKKILLITMNRTRSPIEFEAAHIITVNIDLFVILIKTSYSVYNLLQGS
ncbi:odorant receptor 94b-like [Xylocopa sonorina]|uniref:odorant receptor 94b-like n=1 Tax=Xylocopa sonorina TaxID=1818115 RepID=UPI00403AF23F